MMQQLPKKFWLVFNIPTEIRKNDSEWDQNANTRDNKILNDVAKGQLNGVRGISASREILTDWFVNCRNATLVFDPAQLISVNDIEQVRYDDIDYLCENEFKVLYRLWDKEKKPDHYGLMMNLGQYWNSNYKKFNHNAESLEYYGIATKLAYYWEDHASEYTISSFNDAVSAFQDMLLKVGYANKIDDYLPSPEELRESLWNALKQVGNIYKSEQEWIVKNSQLTVPKGSMLLLAVYPDIVRSYNEWKANPDNEKFMFTQYRYKSYQRLLEIVHTHNLHNIYKIKLINGERFLEHGPEVTRRRRERKS